MEELKFFVHVSENEGLREIYCPAQAVTNLKCCTRRKCVI